MRCWRHWRLEHTACPPGGAPTAVARCRPDDAVRGAAAHGTCGRLHPAAKHSRTAREDGLYRLVRLPGAAAQPQPPQLRAALIAGARAQLPSTTAAPPRAEHQRAEHQRAAHQYAHLVGSAEPTVRAGCVHSRQKQYFFFLF